MLIRITNRCSMGCSHCLADARPEGEHMSRDVFEAVLEFICRIKLPIVYLTGGEPVDHPELFDFLDGATKRNISVFVLSNGMFLRDPIFTLEFLERVQGVQVTNDPRFYPLSIPCITDGQVKSLVREKVSYQTQLSCIASFGRAVTNKLAVDRIAPFCFNFRSIIRKMRSFLDTLYMLRAHRKHCTPSVNINGTIVAGEAPSCHIVGSVSDAFDTLTQNACEMTCNKCGLVDNLSMPLKTAIGE